MVDVEKVLAALQCIASGEYLFSYEPECTKAGCPYASEGVCYKKVAKDAYDLLKNNRARALDHMDAKLLTPEEVKFSCLDTVFFETRSGLLICCIKDEIDSDYFVYFVYRRDRWFQRQYEFYNKTWRCWAHRPTEEQRKAVKWDD